MFIFCGFIKITDFYCMALWSKKIFGMTSILVTLRMIELYYRKRSILRMSHVQWRRMSTKIVRMVVLNMFIRPSFWNFLCRGLASLFIFFLVGLSNVESGVLKYPTTTVLPSIYFFRSVTSCFINFDSLSFGIYVVWEWSH